MNSELLAKELNRICYLNHHNNPEMLRKCQRYIKSLLHPVSQDPFQNAEFVNIPVPADEYESQWRSQEARSN